MDSEERLRTMGIPDNARPVGVKGRSACRHGAEAIALLRECAPLIGCQSVSCDCGEHALAKRIDALLLAASAGGEGR